jgi:hypothetical protein
VSFSALPVSLLCLPQEELRVAADEQEDAENLVNAGVEAVIT